MTQLADVWRSLHRAESTLVAAGVRADPAPLRAYFDGLPVERHLAGAIFRLASGFDGRHLRVADYGTRYPFSPPELIEATFTALVDVGWLAEGPGGVYALTDAGRATVTTYYGIVAGGVDRLTPSSVSLEDIAFLLAADRRLVEEVAAASSPAERPILTHRLRGLRPPWEPARLSHHWQRIWTLVAAHEDAEETVRRGHKMGALVWFARRQIWRGRFAVGGVDDLAQVAGRYAPVDAQACAAALASLVAEGIAMQEGDRYRLTADGAEYFAADETEIERMFFGWWPDLTDDERARLLSITQQLNEEFAPEA